MPNWSDGSGREARAEQVGLLNEIEEKLLTNEVVTASVPPGYGKTYIMRALQRHYHDVDIVTYSNDLIDQAKKQYPQLNVVKGVDHYDDEDDYKDAHRKARAGLDSIYNSGSYRIAQQRGLRKPKLLIIDEAHLMLDMLLFNAALSFSVSKTKIPENAKTEFDLIKWATARYEMLKAAMTKPDAPEAVFNEFQKIAQVVNSIDLGSQKNVYEISKVVRPDGNRNTKHIALRPLICPPGIIRDCTSADRVLFLSGTLSRSDGSELAAGRSHVHITRDYLTPAENRPVYYRPVSDKDRLNVEALADEIRKIYLANPVPTLVHVTYNMQSAFAHALDTLNPLTNSNNNKISVANAFRRRGGIWIAAGLAEGIDLPYDECRQIIIPTLMYPDRGNAFIQKRVGLEGGQHWYKVRTLQNTIQRLGRGVRAADDKCVSYILDPTFPRLYEDTKDEFVSLNTIWSQNGVQLPLAKG